MATFENDSSSYVSDKKKTTYSTSKTPYVELTHFNLRKCLTNFKGCKKIIEWKLHHDYFILTNARIPTGFTVCGFQCNIWKKLPPSLYFLGGQYLPNTKTIGSPTKNYDAMLCGTPLIGSDKVLELKLYSDLDMRYIGRLHYGRIHAACLPLPGGDRIAVIGGDRTGRSIEFFSIKTRTSTVGPTLRECRHHMGVIAISDDSETDVLVLGGLSGPLRGTALRSGEIVCQKMLHEEVLQTARYHATMKESLNTTEGDTATTGTSFQGSFTFREHGYSNHTDDKLLCPWPALQRQIIRYQNKSIAPMKQARAQFNILRIASTPWILVAGGYNGVKPLQTTELYHLTLDIWIQGPLLNYSRMNSIIWQDENMNIYLAGGVEGYDHKPLLEVQKWNASILKSENNLLREKIVSFRILKNVTGPKTNFYSTMIFKTKPCQSKLPLTPMLQNSFKIPKLTIKNSLGELSYQDSTCSTSLEPQNSFESTCDETYDKQIHEEMNLLQAPRHSVYTYFKSPLVTKMKQRN